MFEGVKYFIGGIASVGGLAGVILALMDKEGQDAAERTANELGFISVSIWFFAGIIIIFI